MRQQSGRGRASHAFDDVQAMVVFARVIQERSFTRAARQLGTTTSAVSKRVARLEARTGARLLGRSTRVVVPTEAGLELYERCLRILREVEDADLFVEGLSAGSRGLLRVSAPVYFGEVYVAPLLAALARREPELRVELALEDRFVDLVREGYDLAVRVGGPAGSTLQSRRLARTREVLCASPEYVARRGRPLAPKDLLEHDCLRYTLDPTPGRFGFEGPAGESISIPVRGPLDCNHGGALRQAALAGLGIAQLPRFYVHDAIERGELVTLLEEHCKGERPIFAVYPAAREQLPKTRACVEFLARELPARLATRGAGR